MRERHPLTRRARARRAARRIPWVGGFAAGRTPEWSRMAPDQPMLLPLDAPRGLAADERELLEAVTADPHGSEGLREQVAHARVVSRCSCGCPSIGLDTTEPAAARAPADITAWGRNRAGKEIQVTLFIAGGSIHELEIWGGSEDGVGATDPPDAHTLVFARG